MRCSPAFSKGYSEGLKLIPPYTAKSILVSNSFALAVVIMITPLAPFVPYVEDPSFITVMLSISLGSIVDNGSV